MTTAEEAPVAQESGSVKRQHYAYLLTETDERAIDALKVSGLTRAEATVLYTLHQYRHLTDRVDSHWLERSCDLRQPEVSIALRDFIASGLLSRAEVKGVSKGRPLMAYQVRGDIPKYVHNLIWVRQRQLDQATKEISRVFGETGGSP
jgi:predicted transcriptional regulator